MLCILLLLLAPLKAALAGDTAPYIISGSIGDYAPAARVYEVGGVICKFPEEINVVHNNGDPAVLGDLQGGMRIKVIGEKTVDNSREDTIRYNKIIILTPES